MKMALPGIAALFLGMGAIGTAQVQRTTFRGWESLQLKNEFVQLDVTPQLGGRILGYQLGDHSFLWANPRLQGMVPPSTHLAPDGSWLNWGGDKLWPAPQGWSNAGQWPGPPDPILDGSPQEAKVLGGESASAQIELTSPADPKTGIQFSRDIRLFFGSSRVNIAATMTNISDRPVRWGIWTVTQLDAGNQSGSGWNPNWNTYVPFNPDSYFPRGFQVLYGSEGNAEIQPFVIPGVLKLQYMWTVGKVGLDSSGGWLANVDGSSGYLFVQKFTYDPAATYPDGSTVEVWTNGVGTIQAWARIVRMQADPIDNPYIVESELLGPQVRLMPGEQSRFTYDWYSANIGGDYPILSCGDYGCTCQQLTSRRNGKEILIDGRFGIFYKGRLGIEFLDAQGKQIGTPSILDPVSPLHPLVLDSFAVPAPESAVAVRLVIYQSGVKRFGELAQTAILQ
jgi:Domain of unknown function (DUF4380)